MAPRIVLEARGAFEIVLLCSLALGAAFGAWRWRSAGSPIALLAAYLAGSLCISLALHALLRLRPVEVSTYAVALVAGAFVAWSMLVRRLPEAGLPLRGAYQIIAGCLVLGVVGARLAELGGDALAGAMPSIRGGRLAGLGVFGAFAVDAAYVALLVRFAYPGVSVLRVLDAGSSATLVNVAIARMGCLCNGCCYGGPSSSIVALPVAWFDASSPAARAATTARIWPAQPVESLLALALAAGCHRLWRRRSELRLGPGTVIGCGAFGYGVGRFLLEGVRADSPRLRFGLTIWQYCALALAMTGAVTIARARRTAS